MAVIVFHIWHDALPGGFIGVDVFFVISGYLISLQLYKEIHAKHFSITLFYTRRIKRILPVFYVVVMLTVVIAQFVMVPNDAEKVGASAIWSIMSAANIYFWIFQDNSYFAQSSDESPLLHLWSLGVEEQFYILWPLLLLFLFKYNKPKVILGAILVLSLISLCLAEALYKDFSAFSYYMLPTRMGELLVGGFAAYLVFFKPIPVLSQRASLWLSLLGFIGLILSVVFIDKHFVFPGFIVLIPTLSTALIIYTGTFHQNAIHKLLSVKPLVAIGLISYSAYLWHWPILAFYRYGNFEITLWSGLIILLVTLALAKLSHRYIEVPFRKVDFTFAMILKRYVLIPGAVVLVFSFLVYRSHGYGVRYLDQAYKRDFKIVAEQVKAPHYVHNVCQGENITAKVILSKRCAEVGDISKKEAPKVLLWGDSNLGHMVGTFDVLGKEAGIKMSNIAISSCPPLLHNAKKYATLDVNACSKSIENLKPYLPQYEHLIISAAWTNYTQKNQVKDFWRDFTLTLDELSVQSKSITLIGKIPWVKGFKKDCAIRQLSFPMMHCNLTETQKINRSIVRDNHKLEEIAAQYQNIEYYDFNDMLCVEGSCIWKTESNIPIYYDHTHLSYLGSEYLGYLTLKSKGIPEFMFKLK